MGKRKRTPPGEPAPIAVPDLELIHATDDRTRLTWLGHAGFLVSMGRRHLLIDPVVSSRIGAVYTNYAPSPLSPGDWPEIEAVLISHNHYDHLDAKALRCLPAEVPALVPEGLGRWFRRWNRRPVEELGWWQSHSLGEIEVTMVPSRHWSRRGLSDVNRSHWGGFVIRNCGRSLGPAAGRATGRSIYHGGDSAWFEGFREIGRRFPGLDVAMLPIGAYEPGWFMEKNHLNPEQACRAFLETGARAFVPMHWGALRLTDETLSEPIRRVEAWWQDEGPQDGRRLARMAVGETLVLDAV